MEIKDLGIKAYILRYVVFKFSELADRLLVKLGKRYRVLVREPKLAKHTFCGVGFVHNYEAIHLFEQIFKKFRPARLIELGTGSGGLSSYLKILCVNYGTAFYTYDMKDYREQHPETKLQKLIKLSDSRFIADIFEKKTIENISEKIKKNGCSFIYCDDGNKVREFKTYVKFLKNGDIIGVHDWRIEIHAENIEDDIRTYKLIPIFDDTLKEYFTRQKFFVKKGNTEVRKIEPIKYERCGHVIGEFQ